MVEIKKSHIMRSKFEFLNAGKGQNSVIYSLNCINVKDGEIFATDGHCLHCVSCDLIKENGLYRILKEETTFFIVKDDNNLPFPDCSKVIPSESTKTFEISLRDSIEQTKAIGELYKRDLFINYSFLFRLKIYSNSWTVHIPEENLLPVLFTNTDAKAVLMPFRNT